MSSHFNLSIKELPKTKKMTVDERHPIQKIQSHKFTTDEEEKLNDIGTIYGSAMPMMMRYERSILSQP